MKMFFVLLKLKLASNNTNNTYYCWTKNIEGEGKRRREIKGIFYYDHCVLFSAIKKFCSTLYTTLLSMNVCWIQR